MSNEFMEKAIELAQENICKMSGGPFGAVVVKDNAIVGKSRNMVVENHDATAHAEVSAIRDAGKTMETYDLSGCDIYTSCEPCPMCLMAIKWANIRHIYFAATREDASAIDFRDGNFYNELKDDVKTGIPLEEYRRPAAEIMLEWKRRTEMSY